MNTTYNPPESADPAAEGVAATMQVGPAQWADAWVAFFDTLGVDGVNAMNSYADQLEVDSDGMKVTLCQRVPGVEAVEVGEGEFAEWGWPVRIEVAR